MSIFFNPQTGAVWKLYVQNRKLIVDVPNFSFEILPVNNTRFIPINIQIGVELEFEKPPVRNHLLLHVYAKSIRRAIFETSQLDFLLPELTDTQLPRLTLITANVV